MPLFSRARVDLVLPLLEESSRGGTAGSASNTSLVLARMLREMLSALKQPRLAGGNVAVRAIRLGYRTPDARDLEL